MQFKNIEGQAINDFVSIAFVNYSQSSSHPNLYDDKLHCCGCYACYNRCKELGFNAIQMMIDTEGFFYPVIDSERCKGCLSCVKVCQYHISVKGD